MSIIEKAEEHQLQHDFELVHKSNNTTTPNGLPNDPSTWLYLKRTRIHSNTINYTTIQGPQSMTNQINQFL